MFSHFHFIPNIILLIQNQQTFKQTLILKRRKRKGRKRIRRERRRRSGKGRRRGRRAQLISWLKTFVSQIQKGRQKSQATHKKKMADYLFTGISILKDCIPLCQNKNKNYWTSLEYMAALIFLNVHQFFQINFQLCTLIVSLDYVSET